MNLQKKISGSFDLVMLFSRGIEAFSGTRRNALRSLVIPMALLPLDLLFSAHYPPKGMETGYALGQILMTVFLQAVISFLFSFILIISLAKSLNRLNKFWLYLEASNWVALAAFIVTIPFMALTFTDRFPHEEMDRIFVIVQCYFYIVTACIFLGAFKLNWQLAGFLAVVTLFVNETTWDLLFWLQDIPQPW